MNSLNLGVGGWLQFDNKPSYLQIICNFKHLFISDLSPSIIFDNMYVHSKHSLKKAFSSNYNSFNTWKIRQKNSNNNDI